MFYSIHVRRKTGEWQTELLIRQGNPPEIGDVIEATLNAEQIEARVQALTKNPSKAKGEPAIEVHADEI